MPRSLEFLSEKIQCVIAPQPWCTPEEIRLYPKIVLEAQQACSGSSNEAEIDKYICSAILPKVNGNITPKLPVYNRLFRKRYAHTQRCKALVKSLKPKLKALDAINKITTVQFDTATAESQENEQNVRRR